MNRDNLEKVLTYISEMEKINTDIRDKLNYINYYADLLEYYNESLIKVIKDEVGLTEEEIMKLMVEISDKKKF